MPLSLFFGGGQPNEIGAITLDATLQEVHSRTADITDHPVEGGGTIQDHITNAPKRVEMTGFVTNTPVTILGIGSSADRVQSAFDELERIFDSREPFTVVSGYKVYENMAFESLDMPRRREGAIRFTARLKQLTITQSETVSIPGDTVAEDAQDVASSEVDAGRQQGRTANESEEQQGSLLFQIWEDLDRHLGAQ